MDTHSILMIALCVLGPLGVMWLTHRFAFLNAIGDIIVTYIIGCLVGLSGLLDGGEEMRTLQTTIASASVPFAIPLMLLSSNIKAWASLAPNFTKSLLGGVAACVIAVCVGFYLFGQDNPETYAHTGAMLTGLYTGGTANLASLKEALGVDNTTYLQVHTYSIVVSAVYLLFVIVAGQKVLGLFMPHFRGDKTTEDTKSQLKLENYDDQLFFGLFRKDNMPNLGKAMGLTLGILAVGAGVASLFAKDAFQAVFILMISLLAICAALVPAIRKIKRTFELGTYFILVFSMAVSSQVNTEMFTAMDLNLFYFTMVVTIGALVMHVVLNTIMRIDTDTTLVTSISLICSPPFVPVMSGALGNRAVLGPGIAVGLIGYAIGTYLGFGIAQMLCYLM